MKLIETEKKGLDYILTFEDDRGFFGRLFKLKPTIVKYIGHTTVWYYYPSFKRAGVFTESWLSDIETRLRYESVHGKAK